MLIKILAHVKKFSRLVLLVAALLLICLPAYSMADTWTALAPMPTATTLTVNTIGVVGNTLYAVGGWVMPCSAISTLQAYDTLSNTWTIKAPMPTARNYSAVGEINGIIYVASGIRWCSDLAISTVEAYNPVTNTWATKSPMPYPRRAAASGVINGILYVAGGADGEASGYTESARLSAYNPATDTWTEKAPMPTPVVVAAAGVINGIFYITGGFGGGVAITQVYAYNPGTDSWSLKAPIPTPRNWAAAAVINEKLYVVGGANASSSNLSTVEAYDPVSDTWSAVAPMPTGRQAMGVGEVNGRLYAVGGSNDINGMLSTVEAFTPSTPPTPVCGNGIVEVGEQCDDGNLTAGDGCSATCTIESGWTCSGLPSACSLTPTSCTSSTDGSWGACVNGTQTSTTAYFFI